MIPKLSLLAKPSLHGSQKGCKWQDIGSPKHQLQLGQRRVGGQGKLGRVVITLLAFETLQACSLEPSEEEESVFPTTASSWRGTLSGSVIRFWLWHGAWPPFHRSLTCSDHDHSASNFERNLVGRAAARGQGVVFYPRGWGPEHNTGGRVVTSKCTCQA